MSFFGLPSQATRKPSTRARRFIPLSDRNPLRCMNRLRTDLYRPVRSQISCCVKPLSAIAHRIWSLNDSDRLITLVIVAACYSISNSILRLPSLSLDPDFYGFSLPKAELAPDRNIRLWKRSRRDHPEDRPLAEWNVALTDHCQRQEGRCRIRSGGGCLSAVPFDRVCRQTGGRSLRYGRGPLHAAQHATSRCAPGCDLSLICARFQRASAGSHGHRESGFRRRSKLPRLQRLAQCLDAGQSNGRGVARDTRMCQPAGERTVPAELVKTIILLRFGCIS